RHGVVQCNAGAGDRRAARTTVGLQHVAIDPDRALAPLRTIGNGAQAAPDETLYFLGATALLAFGSFAPHAGVGRARQHSVLCREPPDALAFEEERHTFLHRGRAQYARLT